MKTTALLAALFLLFAIPEVSFAGEDELINSLTKGLEITDEQAKGGAGALFNYAQENLTKDEFEQVASAVPDMSGYLDAIPALGGNNTGMLGKATQSLVGMPAVTAAFDKLGLSQEMVGMFTPILIDYVDEKGGEAVGGLLQKVFTK